MQRAFDLAEHLGYFRYPEVVKLWDSVPGWLRELGSDVGIAAFESRLGIRVPEAMREFYASPDLACFLDATGCAVFLNSLAMLSDEEMPPIVHWSAVPHLVFSFHNRSSAMFGARLGEDDPLTYCGFDDEQDPMSDEGQPLKLFSDWVLKWIAGHGARLDYWEESYKSVLSNPAELARLGRGDWILDMPGMAQRFT